MAIFYNMTVNTLVSQNGDVFFNDDSSDESIRQYLQSEIFKAILLNEVSTNIQTVTQYEDMKHMTGPELNFDISRHVDPENDRGWYNIAPIDGLIGDYMTDGVNIYDFKVHSSGIIIDNSCSLGSSFYQSQSGEFMKSLGNEMIGKMVDSAIEIIGAGSGKIGAVVSIGKFAAEAAIQSTEIDINNKNVDELLRNFELFKILEALQIGSSISDFKNRTTINQAYINNRELQIALYAYEKKKEISITVEEVNSALAGLTNDGNTNDKIATYVKWYTDNKEHKGYYKDELQDVLNDYRVNNPDCKYKLVSSLSLEQLNELNKKLENPKYDLNLE